MVVMTDGVVPILVTSGTRGYLDIDDTDIDDLLLVTFGNDDLREWWPVILMTSVLLPFDNDDPGAIVFYGNDPGADDIMHITPVRMTLNIDDSDADEWH